MLKDSLSLSMWSATNEALEASLQVQHNLWNGFLDRCRTMSETATLEALKSVFLHNEQFWNPDAVRTTLIWGDNLGPTNI